MATKEEQKELSLDQKLISLINELKAPKNQRNSFGKYNYRSAEDILEAVKPLAYLYGLIPNLTDEVVHLGDRYYIKATASITDGVTVRQSQGWAREPESKKGMDESQITGTASSYARKYAMNGLYQIDDTKDADTDEHKQQADAAKPKQITKIQAEAMNKKINELAELASVKTGQTISSEQMAEKLTDTKFFKIIPIEKLDTEQFVTINRTVDEWHKKYQKA